MENEKQIIIKYAGGLGNQMFQYAVGEVFRDNGYKVLGDIRWYNQDSTGPQFLLSEVFPQVSIEYIDNKTAEKYERKYQKRFWWCKVYQHFFIENKLIYYERCPYIFDKNIWKLKNAIIQGYWQSYKYSENIRETLLKNFAFSIENNQELIYLKNKLLGNPVASLHIRGGDYKIPENERIFGDGCSQEYYSRAIEMIKKEEPKVKFMGFTNDLEYAKKVVKTGEVKWFEKTRISGYQDWMDMYLMSLCKYNILANSSFSWWAAWLNRNSDKLVIAPRKWYNQICCDDICPKEWIRL